MKEVTSHFDLYYFANNNRTLNLFYGGQRSGRLGNQSSIIIIVVNCGVSCGQLAEISLIRRVVPPLALLCNGPCQLQTSSEA